MKIASTLAQIAERAAKKIVEVRSSGLQVTTKEERDLVTSADLASQEVILEELHRHFPNTAIVAEEDAAASIQGDTFFVVDPIDGTYNFLHGAPDWSVLIAFIQDGRPVAGTILVPERGISVVAERGAGCFVNNSRVTFSGSAPLAKTLVGSEVGWFVRPELLHNGLVPLANRVLGIRSILGSGASTTELLRGITGAYVNFSGAKIWDFAPGVVAVEEAGGYCVDMHGKPLQWNSVPMTVILGRSESVVHEVLQSMSPDLKK